MWPAILVAVLVICATLAYFASRPQYGFLHRFGAARRASEYAKGLRCYSFTGGYDEVFLDAKRELLAAGWKIDFESPGLAIFKRSRHGVTDETTLATRLPAWASADEPGSTKCMIWLPYQETWMESQMGAFSERLGWREKITPTNAQPFYEDFFYTHQEHRTGSHVVAEIIWKNLMTRPGTARVAMVDLSNFEPSENLPTATTVPPRSFLIQKFTYPGEALGPQASGLLSIKYEYNDVGGPGTRVELGELPEPEVDVVLESDAQKMRIKNNNGARTYEIRNLIFTIDGSKVRSTPGVIHIAPGKTFSFPFDLDENAEPDLTFQYRLLPNRRWRNFKLSGNDPL
jgi:hypothetical protein